MANDQDQTPTRQFQAHTGNRLEDWLQRFDRKIDAISSQIAELRTSKGLHALKIDELAKNCAETDRRLDDQSDIIRAIQAAQINLGEERMRRLEDAETLRRPQAIGPIATIVIGAVVTLIVNVVGIVVIVDVAKGVVAANPIGAKP